MIITSLDNKKVKYIISLKDSKTREIEQKFIIEGEHLINEAIKYNLLEELYLLEGTINNYDIDAIYLKENVMKKISSLTNTSKYIGICKMKESTKIEGNAIILDDIQDPGNLGTIIRSACAFSVNNIILSKNSVDIYNPKVIRSTQGMLFKLNIIVDDLENIINELKNNNYTVLGTDVNNGTDVRDIKVSKYALIMGNEGNGVSDKIKKLCDKNLYINMDKSCESLNVAVASSILLYELRGKNE